MGNRIDVGDIVTVRWEYIEAIFGAEVLHVPCATGDSWVVRAIDGTIHHIGEFCLMTRTGKRPDPPQDTTQEYP